MRLDLQAPYLDSFRSAPFPAAEAAYRDTHRDVAMFAGVRGAKTRTGAEKVAARIWSEIVGAVQADPAVWGWAPLGATPSATKDTPRRRYWIVGPTYTLASEAWVQFRAVLTRVEAAILHEVEGQVWLRTGVLVERRTGSDERQLQAAKLAGAWLDEVCTLPFESYQQVRNRLADLRGWLIMTGSPRPDSWARERVFNRGTTPERGVHHWTTLENPHIPAEEIERARSELADYWFRRDFLAAWDTHPALIYPDWSPLRHVCQPEDVPRTGMTWFGAQDWGYASPGCFLLAGRHGPTGRLYVAEEVYADRLPVAVEVQAEYQGPTWVSMVKPIVEQYHVRQVWTDVSEGNASCIAYRRADIPATVVHKVSVLDGIKTVSRLLQGERPILQVSSRCTNLIREFPGYCFTLMRSGVMLEVPDPKVDDHALDGLRYLAGSLFGVQPVKVDAPPQENPLLRPFAEWSQDDRSRYLRRQRRIERRKRAVSG